MRSFFQYRLEERASKNIFILCLHDIVDNTLYFGCRYKCADFYFQKEWEYAAQNGNLRFFTAFSRDQVSILHSILFCKLFRRRKFMYKICC